MASGPGVFRYAAGDWRWRRVFRLRRGLAVCKFDRPRLFRPVHDLDIVSVEFMLGQRRIDVGISGSRVAGDVGQRLGWKAGNRVRSAAVGRHRVDRQRAVRGRRRGGNYLGRRCWQIIEIDSGRRRDGRCHRGERRHLGSWRPRCLEELGSRGPHHGRELGRRRTGTCRCRRNRRSAVRLHLRRWRRGRDLGFRRTRARRNFRRRRRRGDLGFGRRSDRKHLGRWRLNGSGRFDLGSHGGGHQLRRRCHGADVERADCGGLGSERGRLAVGLHLGALLRRRLVAEWTVVRGRWR